MANWRGLPAEATTRLANNRGILDQGCLAHGSNAASGLVFGNTPVSTRPPIRISQWLEEAPPDVVA